MYHTNNGNQRKKSWKLDKIKGPEGPLSRGYAGPGQLASCKSREFGSLYPWLYQGAGNVAECINSRAAGANAAAEEPWC